MQPVIFQDIALIDYKEAWDYQEKLFNEVVERKLANRTLASDSQVPAKHYLLFCEHPHVYTLGRSGNEENLLVNAVDLEKKQATFYKNNRGGDITYQDGSNCWVSDFRS